MSLPETAVLTAISAGFSLGPDIDHPHSTVSQAAGRPVHDLAHGLSTAARNILATGRDRRRFAQAKLRGFDPSHRSLTHTLVFSVGVITMVYGVAHSSVVTAVVAALCVAACRKLAPRRWQNAILGAAASMLFFGVYSAPSPEHAALAAGAGWISHLIADACTTAGVPLLWPLRIKGCFWWRIRILGGWLKSGERKEYVAAFGVVVVMNLPHLVLS
jgi:membrane-bound metal-dependent hydrolase YbcI (DUF457 family)